MRCAHHWIVTVEDQIEIGRCKYCPAVKVFNVLREGRVSKSQLKATIGGKRSGRTRAKVGVA